MGSFYLLTLKAEIFKWKKSKIKSKKVEILIILFSQSFFVPRLVPGGAIKQVIVRGDGLGLGKLKIETY